MSALLVALAAAQLSGSFGPMLVAVSDGEVKGAFSETRVGNGSDRSPQYSCSFTFKGQLKGETASVTVQTLGEPASLGTLKLTSDSARLRLENNQPGCAATSGDMVGEPYEVSRDGDGEDWTSVSLIATATSRIRSAPHLRAKVLRRLSRGEAVAIRKRNGSWFEVVWPFDDVALTGWVQERDLIAAQ